MQRRIVHFGLLTAIVCLIVFFIIFLEGEEYYMVSLCLTVLILLAFFMGFERKARMRDLLIVVVMSSVAVVSRVAFFFLPQIKPLLAICIITGAALGPLAGFATGGISVFLSNFYFGQGPYTPFQMTAAGLTGYFAGVLFYSTRKLKICKENFISVNIGQVSDLPLSSCHRRGRLAIIIYGILSTVVLYGLIVDLNTIFLTGREFTIDFVQVTYWLALPLNLVHGLSTAIFLFALYRPVLQSLERIQKKYGLGSTDPRSMDHRAFSFTYGGKNGTI